MIKSQRKAFSMITAIFVIIMMAGVGALISSISGKVVKETTDQYQKEQAVLLAKSYTEYAIMTVMSNDRNGTGVCIRDIDGSVVAPGGTITGASTNGEGYNVRIRIGFIGSTNQISSCANTREFGYPTTDELNIIVDAYVEYKDITQPDPQNSPWITYHRRTLQKI